MKESSRCFCGLIVVTYVQVPSVPSDVHISEITVPRTNAVFFNSTLKKRKIRRQIFCPSLKTPQEAH